MKLKKTHVNISLLVLILSLTVAGAINLSFKPQSILESPKTSAGEITIVTPENKTYTEPMSGYYPGTYGFENDEDDNLPDDWIEIKENPLIINEIISELDGHKKVLHMDKGNTYGDNNNLYHNFTSVRDHGIIEFWGRTTDVTQESSWHLKCGSFNQFSIASVRIMDSSFEFRNSTGWFPVSFTANNDQWYHIKIEFECGTGNHYGLAQYQWRMFVNNIQFGDWQMISSYWNVSHFLIHQNWRYDNIHMYIDAVSYSWDEGYNIGDNLNEGLLLSYENSTILDRKKYSLDGQMNNTILGNTTIPIPSEGTHQIQIFGNDTMGTTYESAVRHFSVDTIPPELSITYPSTAQEFSDPPSYILSITEDNVVAMWYTLNGGSNNPISSATGILDSSAWNSLADGSVTIRFYVRDIADREAFEEVIVVKVAGEVSTPPGIPGYDLYLLLGALSIISTLLIRKRVKS